MYSVKKFNFKLEKYDFTEFEWCIIFKLFFNEDYEICIN